MSKDTTREDGNEVGIEKAIIVSTRREVSSLISDTKSSEGMHKDNLATTSIGGGDSFQDTSDQHNNSNQSTLCDHIGNIKMGRARGRPKKEKEFSRIRLI